MSCEVINKELRIFSCNIADLTQEQKQSFLKSWKEGSTIESLTVFRDDKGNIFINADNKYFEEFKRIVSDYMILSADQRELVKDSMKSQSIIEILNVLDNVISYRKEENLRSIKELLNKQSTSWNTFYTLLDIYDSYRDKVLSVADIYQYGVIQGKRAERARRKKVKQCL